jgi:hypothetical protein
MGKQRMTHLFSLGEADAELSADPNGERHASVEPDSICYLAGRALHEGDRICYQGDVYVCRSGNFEPTGDRC